MEEFMISYESFIASVEVDDTKETILEIDCEDDFNFYELSNDEIQFVYRKIKEKARKKYNEKIYNEQDACNIKFETALLACREECEEYLIKEVA